MTPPNALAVFQHVDWSAIPVEQVNEHITRQMFYGDRLMVCRLVLAANTVTPVKMMSCAQSGRSTPTPTRMPTTNAPTAKKPRCNVAEVSSSASSANPISTQIHQDMFVCARG